MFAWLIFGGVAAGLIWWQVHQNRQLSRQWLDNFGADIADLMTRFAWSRTAQMMLAIAACVIVLVVYNTRLSDAGRRIDNLNHTLAETSRQLQQLQMAQRQRAMPQRNATPRQYGQYRAPQQQPQRPAARPAPAATARSGYYPPLVAQPAARPAQNQQTVSPPRNTLEEIYNPEQNNHSNAAVIDGIKKRYENLIVTYMFLSKCGRTGPKAYPVILQSLARDMAAARAPQRLQHDIIIAAQGSYQGIYSRSSCQGADVNTIAAQFANYIKAIAR